MFGEDTAATIGYRSTDAAGNVETAKEIVLKLDQTAPTVTAPVHDGDVFADDQAIVPEIVTRIRVPAWMRAKTTVTLDGVRLQPGDPVALSGLTLGAHVLVATASDDAGNAGHLDGSFPNDRNH